MKVVEIFESIDGEGIRAGLPVTFIRLYGCNLNCSYCDSQYACSGSEYKDMAIDEVLLAVGKFNHQLVTLTGGEPLIHPDVAYLIQALSLQNYKVNIETNGSVDISPYCKKRSILITMDYKCPSSKMEGKMLCSNFKLLRTKDVLKFVVGSYEDLQKAKEVIDDFRLMHSCNIYFSPVFGKISAKEILDFILDEHLEGVRVQLQLHKYIWDPNMRGV